MTHEAGEQGHIVFGWCSAGAPGVDEDKPEGKAPGGIVAGESGIPVYGPGGQILYPLDDDDGDPQTPSVPYPVGWPHSQPHPDRPSTPDTGNGDDGGWGRFPPEVPHPDDDEDGEPDQPGLIPNQGNDDPERLGPEDFDNDGKGKLPRAPGDPGKPAVPLTDESGDPLEHPETQEPLVDENGEPLQGPKGPHGGPVMDPASTNPGDPPLTGPIADPHQGKPFPSAPIGPPSSDQEPHVPPYVPPAGG